MISSLKAFAFLCALLPAITATSFAAEASASAPAEDPAYTRTTNERADKIIATLGIADPAKALRIRDQIAGHYRNLSRLHDARDARLAAAKSTAGSDKDATAAAVKTATDIATAEIARLHFTYVSRLSAELSAEQVEKIKDGMTYGVVPLTYRVYMEMLPDITEEQKIQIKAWLIEAREYAMDGSTSHEKHGWFGKYKGRINNYLSAAGIDMKQAEKAAAARRKAAQSGTSRQP